MQKKRHTLEFLRTMPHLRVRTNTFNAVLRVRSVMAASIHKYFQDRNYVYINTPLLTGSDCEGAGEVFKVTTIGYSDQYKSEEEYYSNASELKTATHQDTLQSSGTLSRKLLLQSLTT